MDRAVNFIAKSLLGIMFLLLFFSAWNDSAVMDELAHIPAGYSYLTQQDYRLNPEHPPLIKDLAAAPLLLLNLNFPLNAPSWTTFVNGQWDMGRIFLYESGNNADRILRFSRFPIMLLAILFGWLFFRWVRNLYGDKAALLALFFFCFSPTFLAHSRYVTTDLGAAFGFFVGIAAFLNFLHKQSWKNLFVAGLAFGLANLLKFSLVLLAPLYIVFGLLWIFLDNFENFKFKTFIKKGLLMLAKILLIGLIGLLLIWLIYLYHVWHYPIGKQVLDTTSIMSSFRSQTLAQALIWMAGQPVLRGLGQYLMGVIMVLQRTAGGNTAYFLGQVSNTGWISYFPILYLLKEHLAFLILALIGLIFFVKNIVKSREKNWRSFFDWLKENFALTASIIFSAIYWLQAIFAPLNIGVRHVLPTFPFIYLLVARQTVRWVKGISIDNPATFSQWLKEAYHSYVKPLKKGLFAGLLLLWMLLSVFVNFPNYLSYYNELAGGTKNGYRVAVDSNYDWGQDLKRLKNWSEKNLSPGQQIAIDYFGGGNLSYYFGSNYKEWHSDMGAPNGFLAISATFLQQGYPYLADKKPAARAGMSIFIYEFSPKK